ncbi:hypothetical protein L7F22_014644 [Adiantum nelumboides]|nr:hypothetical protein [Adiantum nelumboides]
MQGGCSEQKMYMCKHIERGVNLEKLSQLSKSKLTQCEACIGKGRSSQKKAARLTFSGQQSCQNEEKWVCLFCGHVACDIILSNQIVSEEEENGKLGEKKDENKAPASGHAWGHSVLHKHPLAMQSGDNNIYWCFVCKMPVEYPMPSAGNLNDLQLANWRNPLQEAADVLKGKTTKRKGLFKDPAKVCYTMEPVRCVIDTVRSVIDSATHSKVVDVSKLVGAHNLGYGKRHLVKGLINLGNTCFFNSVLQNLLALDALRNHFNREPSDTEGPLTSSLRNLFQEINCEHVSTASSNSTSSDSGTRRGWRAPPVLASDGKVCNPSSLFDAICAKAPRFRGFQQQDSHELLLYLLEGLSLEERGAATNMFAGDYRKVISISFSKVLGQNGHGGDSEAAEEDKEHGKAIRPVVPSLVEDVFGGQLSSTVHCLECGDVSVVHEAILDLSLQIPYRQITKKRLESEDQGNSNLPGGREREEQVGVLETQETVIASTLKRSASKEFLLGSSLSAQAECVNSTLAIRNEPPKDKFLHYDSDFWNVPGSSAENVQHSADKSENIFSINAGAHIQRDDLKTGLNSPTLEQSMDFNASKSDTYRHIDMTIDARVQGKDILASHNDKSSAGIFLLPCESLARSVSTKEKELECNFNKLSCLEDEDSWGSVSEVKGNNGSCSRHLETGETVIEETEPLKGHQEVLGNPNMMTSGREANCGFSDKVKDALGSEQFTDAEDTALHLSLEACLADFIKAELLCGENAWGCEKCSKLVGGTPQCQSSNNKLKFGEGIVSNILVKSQSDNLAEFRVEKDGQALPRALSVNFEEADSSLSAVDDDNVEQTQSVSANRSTPGEILCLFEGEDDSKIVTPAERSYEPQSLLTEESAISNPSLNRHEQPEGNGLGHTCSKMLPTLKMERLSFFSNLFFKTESNKVKTDQQQKLVKRQATKKLLIFKVPLVLTVHLKRFAEDVRGRFDKLSGHVAFSEYLDLRPFLDPRYAKLITVVIAFNSR